MKNLKGFQRIYLRGLAHALRPVIQVGKSGLAAPLLHSVRQALLDHELIKVKFGALKEQRKALSADLARETESELVGLVGNIAILFREHPDPQRRSIAVPVKEAPPPP